MSARPEWILVAMAGLAAAVNGGLGFGFSTLLVPVGLVFVSSRVLNPALVLVEVALNLLSLAMNRRGLPTTWRRVLPLLVGVLPGVIVGSLVLASFASLVLKASTYALLLPLVLLQFAGARYPFPIERFGFGLPAGIGVGLLYSTTTISGPPLAMLLGSRDLAPDEFRAAMAVVRVVESTATLITYLAFGLITSDSLTLVAWLLPAVALGMPLGRLALHHLDRQRFRRLYLGLDAGLISMGLAITLHRLGWVDDAVAAAAVTAVVGFLLGAEWQRVQRGEVAPR
jgi:uncharacterized membrane protein YfcA